MTEFRTLPFAAGLGGPLQGIRVVDLSRLVAGNMMSLQLGDFGADVVKVEPPQGDPLRDWRDDGRSLHWQVYGRNKRSIALNLRRAGDMEALRRLLARADVFIENFRPGTLEEMGLGPDVLAGLNPDLITVRISGFGQTGPYARLPGFGTLVEAMSGFAARTGFPDREPVLPPLALADMIAGLTGANAAMMALFARQRGAARGQVIDLSLLEPIFAALGPEAAIYRTTGKIKERSGSASNTVSPRNVYRCADGKYVALSGSTQTVTLRIFDVIGRPEMKSDPRFATNVERVRHRDLVDAAVGEWFAGRDRDTALAAMRGAGATVGPVYDIADICEDPHFAERGILVEAERPDGSRLTHHNVFPRLSDTPGGLRLPAPEVGEHTAEILAEIGLTPADLETAP